MPELLSSPVQLVVAFLAVAEIIWALGASWRALRTSAHRSERGQEELARSVQLLARDWAKQRLAEGR